MSGWTYLDSSSTIEPYDNIEVACSLNSSEKGLSTGVDSIYLGKLVISGVVASLVAPMPVLFLAF